jgi:hypothetical protein
MPSGSDRVTWVPDDGRGVGYRDSPSRASVSSQPARCGHCCAASTTPGDAACPNRGEGPSPASRGGEDTGEHRSGGGKAGVGDLGEPAVEFRPVEASLGRGRVQVAATMRDHTVSSTGRRTVAMESTAALRSSTEMRTRSVRSMSTEAAGRSRAVMSPTCQRTSGAVVPVRSRAASRIAGSWSNPTTSTSGWSAGSPGRNSGGFGRTAGRPRRSAPRAARGCRARRTRPSGSVESPRIPDPWAAGALGGHGCAVRLADLSSDPDASAGDGAPAGGDRVQELRR